MGAPTIIKSGDEGAPVLNGSVGSLIQVLDYVLVTKLGWSIEFSDTNIRVYRPATGLRRCFKIENTATYSYYPQITAYETMSDINTGSNLFATQVVVVSAAADATSRPYVCIGDGAGVYLAIGKTITAHPVGSGNEGYAINYFGDFEKFRPSYGFNTCVACLYSTATKTYSPSACIVTQTNTSANTVTMTMRINRDISGDVSTLGIYAYNRVSFPGAPGALSIYQSVGIRTYPDAYPNTDGNFVYSKTFIDIGSNYQSEAVGSMPGFYNPHHNNMENLTNYTDPSNGKTFLALSMVGGSTPLNYGTALFEITDGFRV